VEVLVVALAVVAVTRIRVAAVRATTVVLRRAAAAAAAAAAVGHGGGDQNAQSDCEQLCGGLVGCELGLTTREKKIIFFVFFFFFFFFILMVGEWDWSLTTNFINPYRIHS
jgi:hypothetical protein